MNIRDREYLNLQFGNRVLTIQGTAFQDFFSSIMQSANPSFIKIRPYGNQGDSGNDGFIRETGVYYQVYAPETPSVNDAKAAKKMEEDFNKLKSKWDKISEIKEYIFVFNDKMRGTTLLLETGLRKLSDENPGIKFDILTIDKLEVIFGKLNEQSLLKLGFNIDSRKAIECGEQFLSNIETFMDRGCEKISLGLILTNNNLINSLSADNLVIKIRLLEALCFYGLGNLETAINQLNSIINAYPDNNTAKLILAEIYLKTKKYEENQEILDVADKNHWLYNIQVLLRKFYLNERIASLEDNVLDSLENDRIKSECLRIYAAIENANKEFVKARIHIEQAIRYNPNSIINRITKLVIEWNEYRYNRATEEYEEAQLDYYQNSIDETVKEFSEYGELSNRLRLSLLILQMDIDQYKYDQSNLAESANICLNLILNCQYDIHIEDYLIFFLQRVHLPKDNFLLLIKYLTDHTITITESVFKLLIIHFNEHHLLTEGKEFFDKKSSYKYFSLIENIHNENYDAVINAIKDDVNYSALLCSTLLNQYNLRMKIYDILPANGPILKEKLLISIYVDSNNYDDAFNTFKSCNIASFTIRELKQLLPFLYAKKVWDVQLLVLAKLLPYEKDDKKIFKLRLNLFEAYAHLKDYNKVIEVGNELINYYGLDSQLNENHKEYILAEIIKAYIIRGRESEGLNMLKQLVDFNASSKFLISIKSQLLIENKKYREAIDAIIEGIKSEQHLTPEKYASLFYYFLVITKYENIDLTTNRIVEKNHYVKLKNEQRWYYIGNSDKLDAIPVNQDTELFKAFIDKSKGETVVFPEKYVDQPRSGEIEFIYSIEQYIYWNSNYYFNNNTLSNMSGVMRVDLPHKEDGSLEFKYLIKFFEESKNDRDTIFKEYCNNIMPFAILAFSEGGIGQALSRIGSEKKGFLHASPYEENKLISQKDIAQNILTKNISFYLDGTTAYLLVESGYLEKIVSYLPGIQVPLSVINMLLQIAEGYQTSILSEGFIGYEKGTINYTGVNFKRNVLLRDKIFKNISLLEKHAKNIGSISEANKNDCMSELKVPSELCDGCILARRENIPLLTDDPLYLDWNEFETEKPKPVSVSSFLLFQSLFENKLISFDEYLDYFEYLCNYRYRFLSIQPKDIIRAVFGDGIIVLWRPDNINKLSLSFLLSNEYGADIRSVIRVIALLVQDILLESTLPQNYTDLLIKEIYDCLPFEIRTKEFLSQVIDRIEENLKQNRIILSNTTITKIKNTRETFK